ncbi:MAG: hypothetical protein NT163_09305 [Chlorobiales bacterium]|nr:hypothetical protein [Chlorobiales bacterium]
MPKELSESILEELEKRKVDPIPRSNLLIKRIGFWVLAVLSVITGSFSMAVAMYVLIDQDFILDQENINRYLLAQPFIADIISCIPYLWLAVLALLTLVAYLSFRHTNRGYRYPTIKVVAGSLFASLLLSVSLNTVDVGKHIHRFLFENIPVYHTLIYSNELRWSHADRGLLGCKVIQYDKKRSILIVKGFKNRLWQIDTRIAEVCPGTPIIPGKYLKIKGVKTGIHNFQAITIQRWAEKYHKRVAPSHKIDNFKNLHESEIV